MILFSFDFALAVRPFVTDDARIVDHGQVTSEVWLEKSLGESTLTPDLNALIGAAFTEWLELTVAGGLGLAEGLGKSVSNPVFQSKLLLRKAEVDGQAGIALSAGYVPDAGAGRARFDGSTHYLLGLFSKRLESDNILLHLNLGYTRSWISSYGEKTRPFWGAGTEVALWKPDWRGVFEVFSGDPFHPVRSDLATQAGFRWLHSDLLNFDFIVGAEPEVTRNFKRTGDFESWVQLGIRITGDVFTPGGRAGRNDGGNGLF